MNNPVSGYVRAFLGVHLAALRAAWREQDRGASAVNWSRPTGWCP